MPEYDSIAATYDQLYSYYTEDIDFYVSEAKKAKGAVLEVGCGTGRLYLPILAAGVDAYGMDVSAEMVSRLKRKAADIGFRAKAQVADMRTFRHRKKFALIIVPFRVFLHLLTSEDQLSALKSLRRALAPGGKIIMNFFLPSAEFIHKNYGREVAWQGRAGMGGKASGITARDTTRFTDEPNQQIRVTQKLFKNGRKIAQYDYRLALIYKREFELLLRLAGFGAWRVYGGFKKEKLESSKQEMVWVIEG